MKTTDRNRVYSAREPIEASEAAEHVANPFVMLRVTRTITDHIPLVRDPDSMGLSIGQQIDNHLANAAREYIMIQTVALEFEPDSWHEFASTLRGDPRRR